MVKNLPVMQKNQVRSLSWEGALEKGWLPTPVFLSGESHGQRSLVSYSLWSCKESDRTEQLTSSLATCLQVHVTFWCTEGKVKWKSLSRVWLFATPWLYSPRNSPGQNTGVASLCLLQGIFPTQGPNPGLPHCRRILYHLSHLGSPNWRLGLQQMDLRGTQFGP